MHVFGFLSVLPQHCVLSLLSLLGKETSFNSPTMCFTCICIRSILTLGLGYLCSKGEFYCANHAPATRPFRLWLLRTGSGKGSGRKVKVAPRLMLTDFNRDKFCLVLRNETFLMKTKILALFSAYRWGHGSFLHSAGRPRPTTGPTEREGEDVFFSSLDYFRSVHSNRFKHSLNMGTYSEVGSLIFWVLNCNFMTSRLKFSRLPDLLLWNIQKPNPGCANAKTARVVTWLSVRL